MKRHLVSNLAVMLVFVVTSCVTTPVERQEATSKSLSDLEQAIVETRSQVEKTLASLNAFARAPEVALRDSYQEFNKDAETTAKQAQRLEADLGELRRRSEDWLTAWKEAYGDVKNPELRAMTEQRREQVLARFYTIDGSLAAAQQALKPFVTNLNDIRKVAGYDLTARGMQAVSSTSAVPQANENGRLAAAALDVAVTDLQNLMTALTPSPSQ